jgi:type 1 fimbria pilin
MKRNLILLFLAIAVVVAFSPVHAESDGTITFTGSIVVAGCTGGNCTQTVSTVPATSSDEVMQYFSSYTNGQGEVITIVYK